MAPVEGVPRPAGKTSPHHGRVEQPPPDGGWGWMVMIANFVSVVLSRGVGTSMSIFFVEFLRYFDSTAAETSWIVSANQAALFAAGPFASLLCKRFGIRPVAMFGGVLAFVSFIASVFGTSTTYLCISFGIIGLAFGLYEVPAFICLGQYFKKRHTTAMGFVLTGLGLGFFILPPLTAVLIEHYGWKGTLMILGALSANLCACAALLRPLNLIPDTSKEELSDFLKTSDTVEPDDGGDTDDGDDDALKKIKHDKCQNSTTKQNGTVGTIDSKVVLKNGDFRVEIEKAEEAETHRQSKECFAVALCRDVPILPVFLLYFFFYGLGQSVMMCHLVSKAIGSGISAVKSTFLISIMGVFSALGCLSSGMLIDFIGIVEGRLYIHSLALATFGLTTLLTSFTATYGMLVTLSVMAGLSRGVMGTLDPVISKQVGGVKRFGEVYGLVLFFYGVGFLLGGPISGHFYDTTGSYELSFHSAGICMVVASLLIPMYSIYDRLKWKIFSRVKTLTKKADAVDY